MKREEQLWIEQGDKYSHELFFAYNLEFEDENLNPAIIEIGFMLYFLCLML